MKKPFADTFSNVFDSIAADQLRRDKIESTIAHMLIAARIPVLTLPQAGDSIVLLSLAENYNFRKIIENGFLTVSLYGVFHTLGEYILSRLKNEAFIFSSLPFLENLEKTEVLEVKACLWRALENNDADIRDLPENALAYSEELYRFFYGNIYFDEALKKENYRRQKAVAHSDTHNFPKILEGLLQKYTNETVRADFNRLYSGKAKDRSFYYDAEWRKTARKEYPEDIIDEFVRIVDLSYNLYLKESVSDLSFFSVDDEFENITPLLAKEEMAQNKTLYHQLCSPASKISDTNLDCFDWSDLYRLRVDYAKMSEYNSNLTIEELHQEAISARAGDFTVIKDSLSNSTEILSRFIVETSENKRLQNEVLPQPEMKSHLIQESK